MVLQSWKLACLKLGRVIDYNRVDLLELSNIMATHEDVLMLVRYQLTQPILYDKDIQSRYFVYWGCLGGSSSFTVEITRQRYPIPIMIFIDWPDELASISV